MTRYLLPMAMAVLATRADAVGTAPVSFNRDVRPIFSKHCTACHGGVKAAGGISFVYRDKALATGKSGESAIVAGRPTASALIRRVTTDDPDELMPQPEHGPRLTDEEVAVLTRWIEQGAKWSEHWSFVPPVEVAPPDLRQKDWPQSRLDAWVLARLEADNLAPSRPAEPAEWLRRVSLDLTGLPPTVWEFEAFQAARQSGEAIAKASVVDRLLQSPHFGERWASVWLDLARYSDTYGFEKDPHREIWPWRDWVIRAFNDDLPFDQFTIKQLAGDLLPSPSADDLLATAFHRNTQNNTEGGTDDEEFRTAAVIDRVNTTWTAWQATTFGCVQCHAHPYDPFPHRDYYRFAAFFNNTEDCDQNDDFPRLPVPQREAQRAELARLVTEQKALRADEKLRGTKTVQRLQDTWRPWSALSATASGGQLTLRADGRVDASGTLPIGVNYTLTMPPVDGLTALRLTIFPESDDPKKWLERGAVLSHLTLHAITPEGKREPVKLRGLLADYEAGPYDAQASLTEDPAGFGSYPVLTGPRWCIVLLESPLQLGNAAKLELTMAQKVASNSGTQAMTLRHFQWSTSTDTGWVALAKDEARLAQSARLNEVRTALSKLSGPKVPVIQQREGAAGRTTRVFARGNRLSQDESVECGIPLVSRPPEKQSGLTRLDMAQWLVSKENTLTARVLANRLWAEMFGRGLVETLEDFGTSGARPTHPELLDHLALRLRDTHRWSVKSFLRELALSATYGQTSRLTPPLAERDPHNMLLARGPRSRLTGEMVRDQALAVSGLLESPLFGPPVYPPQPEGVWGSVYSGAKWETSKGADRSRRAIYTYSKRTSGYPGFLLFDAPTRDACAARRIPTNTPLQALVSLNDPAFYEMAQALAKRMVVNGTTTRQRVAYGCQLFTLNAPPARMVDTLVKLHDQALAEPGADASKAMTLVANTLLNLDSALVR